MKFHLKTTVFAPHDRINYGDFLFAIMLDYSLKKYSKQDIKFLKHSIIKSDFSSIGAYSSKSYKELSNDINKLKINNIIIGGGNLLVLIGLLYSLILTLYFIS